MIGNDIKICLIKFKRTEDLDHLLDIFRIIEYKLIRFFWRDTYFDDTE